MGKEKGAITHAVPLDEPKEAISNTSPDSFDSTTKRIGFNIPLFKEENSENISTIESSTNISTTKTLKHKLDETKDTDASVNPKSLSKIRNTKSSDYHFRLTDIYTVRQRGLMPDPNLNAGASARQSPEKSTEEGKTPPRNR